MAFFNKKNKKEQEIKDLKHYEKVESELIVHNMPSHERLNKDIDNPRLLGGIDVKGGETKAKQDSKKIGIIIISLGLVVILAIAFLTYKYAISPAATDKNNQNKELVPSKNSGVDKEIKEEVNKDVKGEVGDNKDQDIPDGNIILEENKEIKETDNSNASSSPMQEEFAGVNAEELTPLIDSDGDGLFDEEELVLGTSIYLPDSDDDGHSDLVEIKNSYNPLSTGFLSEASSVSIYKNTKPAFSFLYPKVWEVKKVNDNLFVFDLGEDSIIQLTIIDNEEKQSILNWYQESFSDLDISNDRLLTNDLYEGVISKDLLNVYLASNLKEKIFIFSYTPASPGRLTYANIFKMIYSSLAK